MTELAGPAALGKLGPHDLTMMLLSAYLHDIGMTPPLAKLDGHLAFLLSGDRTMLNAKDVAGLQAWLDDEWDGLVPPLSTTAPNLRALRLARRIIASYVRHRHNDWSEDWIRENLANVKEPYPGWLDDLVKLCKSHHFDINQLRSDSFAPRLVGAPGTVLHLRYCACILRVADVLDFDPERTPAVLFNHRDVTDSSAIFWHKDQGLSFELKNGHLTLHARPTNALTHHAIDMTLRDVDSELLLSRRLADETDFRHMAGRDNPLPHRWLLDTNVRAVIKPRDDAYEYINGTFRPDSKRLLGLVGGIELYGSHFAAVREILQNAFDAVREQIARERLLQPDPSDLRTHKKISQVHRVSLSFEPIEGHGYRLVCRDTGTGMSRDIIRSRFLVGGTSETHESRALERACNEYGFSVGRTARFGIGVLSYFILGSHLTVNTRRSLEAGDPDGTGWTFTSSGLEDFGELKRNPGAGAGSEVILTVRDGLIRPNATGFASRLLSYVSETIRRVPCSFTFEAPGCDYPSFSHSPGWIDRPADIEDLMLASMIPKSGESTQIMSVDLVPSKRRQALEKRDTQFAALKAQAAKTLKAKVYTRTLPHNLGVARIVIGMFDLHWGSSFVYLDLDPESEDSAHLRRFPLGDGGVGASEMQMSWNGMAVRAEARGGYPSLGDIPGVKVEIDWTNDGAGRLAVHRNSFVPSKRAEQAMRWVRAQVAKIQERLVEREHDSRLAFLNSRLLDSRPTEAMAPIWLVSTVKDEDIFRPLTFPVINSQGLDGIPLHKLTWKGGGVDTAHSLQFTASRSYGRALTWHGQDYHPTALGVIRIQNRLKPVPVWEKLERSSTNGDQPVCVDFPPEWISLVSIDLESTMVPNLLNANHPLLRAIDPDGWEWAKRKFGMTHNPLPHSKELMSSPSRVAAWIIGCVEHGETELWEAISERSPSFLTEAWSAVDGLDALDEVVHWIDDEENRLLFSLSPTKWDGYSDRDAQREFSRRFPTPVGDWWLTHPRKRKTPRSN